MEGTRSLKRTREDSSDPESGGESSSAAPPPPKKAAGEAAPYKKPQRMKPQVYPAAVSLPLVDSDRHVTVHAEDTRSALDAGAVDSEAYLQKLQVYKDLITKVQINIKRKPAAIRQAEADDILDSIFKQPVYDGRDFVSTLSTFESQARQVYSFGATSSSTGQYRFICAMDAAVVGDESKATRINDLLTTWLNSCPAGLDGITFAKLDALHTSVQARPAIQAALAKVLGRSRIVATPKLQKKDKMIGLNLNLIDPVTHKTYSTYFSSQAELLDVPEDFVLPADVRFAKTGFRYSGIRGMVPDENNLCAMSIDKKTGHPIHASGIEDSAWTAAGIKPEIGRKAENFMRGLSAHITGRWVREDQFKTYCMSWMKGQGGSRSTGKVLNDVTYDNSAPLFYFVRNINRRQSGLKPSSAVQRDTTGSLPRLRVPSLDRKRILPVADAITNHWLETGDLKGAWLAGAKITAAITEDICNGVKDNLNRHCECDGKHHCATCGLLASCKTMKRGSYGLRDCGACYAKQASLAKGYPEERAFLLAKKSLIEEELKKLGLQDQMQVKQLVTEIEAHLALKFQDKKLTDEQGRKTMDWPDAYARTVRTLDSESYCLPEMMSVDACNPYGKGVTGYIGLHVAENIELTSYALNQAKDIQLVAILDHLRRYMYAVELLAKDTSLNDEAKAEKWCRIQSSIIALSRLTRQVRLKAGFLKASRTKRSMPDKYLESDKEQWRAAVPRPGDDREGLPWNKRRFGIGPTMGNGLFTDSDRARILKVAQECEKEFGVELPRSKIDGFPYFLCAEAMPDDYDEKMAHGIAGTRFHRIRQCCNVLGCTIETTCTIFVEVIFIACVQLWQDRDEIQDGKLYTLEQKRKFKQKYGEFLGLPMVMDTFDALCFALAHWLHGRDMQTGFMHDFKSLADRDEARNNMLMETRTSNYVKMDFRHEDYPRLRAMIRNSSQWTLVKNVADDALDFEDLDITPSARGHLIGVEEGDDDELPDYIKDEEELEPVDAGKEAVAVDSGEQDFAVDNGDGTTSDLTSRYDTICEWLCETRPSLVGDEKVEDLFHALRRAEEATDYGAFESTKDKLQHLAGRSLEGPDAEEEANSNALDARYVVICENFVEKCERFLGTNESQGLFSRLETAVKAADKAAFEAIKNEMEGLTCINPASRQFNMAATPPSSPSIPDKIQMKAVVIYEVGGPEVLKVEERPIPTPKPGWVLIRVKAFGLNRSEMFTRQGHSPVQFPRILGIEATGLVEHAPNGEFEKGDIVATAMGGMGRAYDGGYSEYTSVPATQVQKLKTTLPWDVLGALPEMLQTSWGSLFKALQLHAGDTLLIRGGTTSIGLAASAIAKSHGVTVYSTTRNPSRTALLKDHGASDVFIDNGTIAADVQSRTKGGVNKVLELIGTTTLLDSLQCAKANGIVCMTGIVGDSWTFNSFKPMEAIPNSFCLTSYGGGPNEFMETPLQELVEQIEKGELEVKVGKTFKLEEIVEAHRVMEGNGAGGKIVVLT
ncbi:hypothetical protein PRZ48_006415 [Zasmidium cellare]|uniref:Enoyl reductase (ER) domain-containing protein n=1 Tax=Zasmidium cellare TaxID=395010 RepID=A0ABR0EQ98_ZASCE|nr:hypothetical protein PRZ48_006415 [Zasmidium cellare]